MILDLDAGNSRIKWRLIGHGKHLAVGTQDSAAVAAGEKLELPETAAISEARLVSVASPQLSAALHKQLHQQFSITLKIARVSKSVGVVTCAYEDPQKLGVDRWLAVLAAYQQFQEGLLVVDAGTAITMDLLGPNGQHLGGYIVPGLHLMSEALSKGTEDVNTASGDSMDLLVPGKNSQQAVNRGCLLVAVAGIEKLASQYPVRLVVTGGDAQPLIDALSLRVTHCPDLVLDGLSVAGVDFVAMQP